MSKNSLSEIIMLLSFLKHMVISSKLSFAGCDSDHCSLFWKPMVSSYTPLSNFFSI
jgi:hypothetical protein